MNVYDFQVKAQDGSEVSLSDYKGKVLLIVNTATGCGFTPQYNELQALYDECHDKGLEILDFPCNQFGEQAPGSDEDTHTFCTVKFGTAFPLFAKQVLEVIMSESKYDALKIENQICFPLYACSREIIKSYKPFLDEIDLTYTQYIAMMVLWEHKTMNVKAMGEILYLDSGTLTPLLKKLESKGLVSRQRSTEDERNLVVTITESGEALKEKAVAVPEAMAKCSNIEPEEAAMLYKILYKMLGKEA